MDLYFQTIIPKVNNESVFVQKTGITNDYVIQSMNSEFKLLPSEELLLEKYLKDELGFQNHKINFNSALILFLIDFHRFCEYHRYHDQ